jgi:hypothetical protein
VIDVQAGTTRRVEPPGSTGREAQATASSASPSGQAQAPGCAAGHHALVAGTSRHDAEADNCVRTLHSGSIATFMRRLGNIMKAIESSASWRCDQPRVRPGKARGARAHRRERELLREQRRAEQELVDERETLEEKAYYENALRAH